MDSYIVKIEFWRNNSDSGLHCTVKHCKDFFPKSSKYDLFESSSTFIGSTKLTKATSINDAIRVGVTEFEKSLLYDEVYNRKPKLPKEGT